ncbi:hypothetical protein [Deinococcus sp. LM3]|uniref:hypothetical protein n=1 Tax=Deinococcus sp. LM3 TaxID=1938608 RepID=UPI00117CF7F9|nr:hypothetical protein [Deinococcus sp. LM3]
MDTVTLKPGQLRRYREFQRNNSIYTIRRNPLYYYKVEARGNHIPVNIIDNPELPSHMRQAIRQACWSERDWAVFEVLISSGARVAEVCEATWAGVRAEGFEAGLALHTKGQGRLPYKSTSLTPEALTALTRYCATERTAYDPLHVQFHAWNRGRSWTSSRYLEFLKKRKINPATVPIFINERRKPYNRNAFDKNPIAKLRNRAKDSRNSGLRLLVSAHHWRHWYINLQLDKIAASSQNVDEHTDMLVKFVDDMGWKHWSGLSHYDHRGQATKLLRAREEGVKESHKSDSKKQSFRVIAEMKKKKIIPEENPYRQTVT